MSSRSHAQPSPSPRAPGPRPRLRFEASLTACALGLAHPARALDDLLLYSDVGCDRQTVETSFAQASGGPMKVGAGQKVPITCAEKHAGTDAVELDLSADLGLGGYYDFILKFPDWGQKDVSAYKDVRFFAKNALATPAHIGARFENANSQPSPKKALTIPGDSDWAEYVLPLSDFGDFTSAGKVDGFGFSQPQDLAGSALHLYIDDIRITDGTGQGAVSLPADPGGRPPAAWPPYFMVGSYDNYQDQGYTPELKGAVDYRYNYLNGDGGWKSYSGGKFIPTLVSTGRAIGAKPAFTWYYVSQAGEGAAAIEGHLADAAFMSRYFDDYDLALSQMAAAGASDAILVLEPDMYGFLMQQDTLLSRTMDAARIKVDMSRASALAGKAYRNDLRGYATYMITRARAKLPGVVAGHLLNHWGVPIPGDIGHGTLDAHVAAGAAQARFLNSLGDTGKGDVFFVEKADRDAGTKGPAWSWTKENYDKYFAWVKTLSARAGLRACGWQVSEGHDQSPPANRDDAARYFLDHGADWAAAGFIGILFGPGTQGQADYHNDGGWFVQAMKGYRAQPLRLDAAAAARGPRARPPARGPSALRGRDLRGRMRARHAGAKAVPGPGARPAAPAVGGPG